MPLPLILGIAAAIAGLTGVGAAIDGGIKMSDANDKVKKANTRHEMNIKYFEKTNKITTQNMDNLGKLELTVLKSFKTFSDNIELIQNKPTFEKIFKENIDLPKYDKRKLEEVSVGASVLLGGLGGAGMGVAGGFAAAGATTAAVTALATASTGTAISTLSGAALTNATMAALGGGAIAAGGGGMALGATILGVTSLGIGLLIGGIIFSCTGDSISNKADEAYNKMKEAEKKIDSICKYLNDLSEVSISYIDELKKVYSIYNLHLNRLDTIVNVLMVRDWTNLQEKDKVKIQNCVLLVGLLYNMCKVKIVLKSDKKDGLNEINYEDIDKSISISKTIMNKII